MHPEKSGPSLYLETYSLFPERDQMQNRPNLGIVETGQTKFEVSVL